MLNAQAAQERLKSLQVGDWEKRRFADIATLPDDLRSVAYGILALDAHGKPYEGHDWTRRLQWQNEAQANLERMRPDERIRIFAALCPTLAIQIEQVWQFQAGLPYQISGSRKAFRAPHKAEALRLARTTLLSILYGLTGPYEQQDVVWLSAWAGYMGPWYADCLGRLFAAVIDGGGPIGEAVFDVLIASARGEHEIGAMGRHVTRGLLAASRPDGWEFMEKFLLAAQRQEGLRQNILETIDEAHPGAFRRMLRVILDNGLVRFSATIRALDVWFGFGWQTPTERVANAAIGQVLRFLEEPETRSEALTSGDGQSVYLALWTYAFEDAQATIPQAARFLEDADVERRFAAAHLLAQLGLEEAGAALYPALDDADLRVAAAAFNAVHQVDLTGETDLFERLQRLVERCPKETKALTPMVWPWMLLALDRQQVASALKQHLGKRPPQELIPYLPMMTPYDRAGVAELLAGQKKWDARTRETVFDLVGDASGDVRAKALDALARVKLSADEAALLEPLLSRKAADLRRGVISVLLNQPDEEVLASAERLLETPQAPKRQAGLEILQQMVKAQRAQEPCRVRAQAYAARTSRPTETESHLLDAILEKERKEPTLDDALGLMDPAERTRPVPPTRPANVLLGSDAAMTCVQSLDRLIHQHRETPVIYETWNGSKEEQLLGNIAYGFPAPKLDVALEEDSARLPLRDLWETWWEERPEAMRDPDGLELLRGSVAFAFWQHGYWLDRAKNQPWLSEAIKVLGANEKLDKLGHGNIVQTLLMWLLRLHPPVGAVDLLLDGVETTLTLVPEEELKRRPVPGEPYWKFTSWQSNQALSAWLQAARQHRTFFPATWEDRHHLRFWRLVRWMDEPVENSRRFRPPFPEVLTAYRLGGATEADLIDHLLGLRDVQHDYGNNFPDLRQHSGRKPVKGFENIPIVQDLIARCRQRILEVEMRRGDLPTAASAPALHLRWSGGLETLVPLLRSYGPDPFVRAGRQEMFSKPAIFSHLIRATMPSDTDTKERFAAQMAEAGIPANRLVDLAVYAPQWAGHVETTLQWPQFAEAVWWIHAHTKDDQWSVDQEIREEWAAQSSERTPLSAQDLLDGAVDVAWFHRIYAALGAERWTALDNAARYASGGGGHKRAQLFADAMLGRVTKPELIARITDKRNKDAVRALGLLPLAEGEGREPDLLERYKVIQEFIRTCRQFGSQRQESEKLAGRIGMENLARTAGFPDPIRLQWAMEAQAVADLAQGAISVEAEGVLVSLAIDPWGKPNVTFSRAGKPLKTLSPAAKKDPAVAELLNRKREIERQASRMRQSLEQAMCRGDRFTGAELSNLMTHPVLMPMLRSLVFIGDGRIGYPVDGGRLLESHDGTTVTVPHEATLRIAHPHDLLASGDWPQWQRDCFLRERIQPFKQVFRELYVRTDGETTDVVTSRRYDGHQVNPKQAMALLGARGWVSHAEEGVRRTFHEEDLAAWLTFDGGYYTPAEVEGLTIAGVQFTRRGEWKPIPLTEVPPRLFSEVMRDLDLVVSVAHRGGVDPEASASTVEMRAALLREACTLLKITNVRHQSTHVLIDGELATYSVHLGSAIVHRQPGGHLCIVPVHSQHRGRLFLPFADDDPKTAEVVSKVILLARDKEIKDPTILEQILG